MKYHIALLQNCVSPDRRLNHEQTIQRAREAAQSGSQVICTQELYSSHYFCQTEDHKYFSWAEPIDGYLIQSWQKFCKEYSVVVVVSFFEKRAHGIYHNSAVVVDADGSLAGIYRKSHIPDDPQFMEKFYFTPGDTGYRVFNTKFGKIGVLICWDQWFPEAARITALMGAEIIFYPTAIGWLPSEKDEFGQSQLNAWLCIQRSHAIANGCFIAAANRIGMENNDDTGGIEFWGNSFLIDPYGNFISRASSDKEEILRAEMDLNKIDEARTHWPFLRDRRIDAYSPLLNRYIDKNE